MTCRQRFARLNCWRRGYHVETPTIGKFRYDVSGVCADCGIVGTGNLDHDETEMG